MYYTLLTHSKIIENPIEIIKNNKGFSVPTFIAKAGLDRININKSIDLFYNELEKMNTAVQYEEHKNGKHGFDIFNNDDESKRIIKATINFLKKRVNEKY